MKLTAGNGTIHRVAALFSAGMLAACLSLASTLPKPTGEGDSATSAALPGMMDASSSYASTGSETPALAPGGNASAVETPAAAPLRTQVASGELSPANKTSGAAGSDHQGCVPEPVSVILMTSGLLGLLAARRFRK